MMALRIGSRQLIAAAEWRLANEQISQPTYDFLEIAACDEAFAEAIENGASELELRHLLREQGVACLLSDALQKVAAGTTDISEVKRMSWVELHNPTTGGMDPREGT